MKFKLTVPTDISEIKLKDYQRFMRTVDGSNDVEFVNQKMVECFCGIDLKDVAKISLSDLDNLVEHFNKLFESKGTFKNRFRLNGIDYGFIPNLDKISNGEYMDIDSNITDVQNYHIVLGVMYRPITDTFKDKYKIEEYEPNDERFELMKELPLDIALSAIVFFYHLGNELLKALPYFLEEEMDKMNTQSNTSLDKNGDGIKHSINLLKEMLPELMQSVEKNFLKV